MLNVRAPGNDMLSAALDLLLIGVVLVDADSRIVHTNRAGARQIGAPHALRHRGGRLSAHSLVAAAALRAAIAEVVRPDRPHLAGTGIAVPIAGPDGRNVAAWVLPLDAAACSAPIGAGTARAAVFLREIGETARLPGEMLARHYRLTPAECRVLRLLTAGQRPHEMAAALGCSETTVRTHLRHLFTKTGSRGQADLVRLALSALAPASR